DLDPAVREKVVGSVAKEESRDVLLQLAITAPKLPGLDPVPLLLEVLSKAGDDKLIPGIVWQNLHPQLEDRAASFLAIVRREKGMANLGLILPRAVERILARRAPDPVVAIDLLGVVLGGPRPDEKAARQCLDVLSAKVQSGEISGEAAKGLRE